MFTKFIYPLILRRIIGKIIKVINVGISGENVPLEFAKNIRLDLRETDCGHRDIIVLGYMELKQTRTMLKLANESARGGGGVLFDVGANYGYYSCLWASVNNNKTFAFEASPLNVKPLSGNIAKNRLEGRITVIPKAAGEKRGVLPFMLGNETQETGWGGLAPRRQESSVDVEVITLDEFALEHNINRIDVLKIDTEGADTWVLYGAKNLLQNKKIRHIFFEHNISRMKALNITEQEVFTFLDSCGYSVKLFTPGKQVSEYYAFAK